MSELALAVAVLVLAGPPTDPLKNGEAIDVVGWSADEARLAVRWFSLAENEGDGDATDCPGYVDQNGKPFRGALTLAAYEGQRVLQVWLIQDYPACTPPAQAQATLKEAKAAIAKLGITLNPKAVAEPGYKLETKDETSVGDADEEGMEGLVTGKLSAWVTPKNGTARQVAEIPVNVRFSRMMGGRASAGFYKPAFSPSGNVVVLRAFKRFTSGRGGGDDCIFSKVYRWNGKTLKEQ